MKDAVERLSTRRRQVRVGIGIKLSLIIGLLSASSLLCVTLLASHFVGEDVRVTAQSNNLTINNRSASLVEDKLNTVRQNVFQLLDIESALSGPQSAAMAKQTQAFFFERNSDIASIFVLNSDESGTKRDEQRMVNLQFLISNETDEEALDAVIAANVDSIARSCRGETIAINASPYLGFPAMSLLFPWKENGRDQSCVITMSAESISNTLGMGSINTTFIVNDGGDFLSHPDTDRLIAGESAKHHPLVEAGLRGNNTGGAQQTLFTAEGEDGKAQKFYGAWQKIDIADIAVLTTVPLEVVTEGVMNTLRSNLYLTAVIMFISMALILIYAKVGITRHLRALTRAADDIQKGNFDTQIISTLNTKRQDEIGALNLSVQHEQTFLHTFARFTNTQVAKSIAAGTLDFAPHLKDLTIFFSDIRGFTAISDGFKQRFGDNSPKEIIGFLNDYMARMVDCVALSGGNIDKFEGDAIMGVWGILRDEGMDYEALPDSDPRKKHLAAEHQKHVVEDAINCVRGVCAMRYALSKYNKEAEAYTKAHSGGGSYKPHIRIGCGINTGRATAGIMGSEYKMEYTAIGDAVNFASRTESSNKVCGTDILITEDTYNTLKKDFIRCKENDYTIADDCLQNEVVVEMIPVSFEVKGKGTQHFYGVVNMPHLDIEAFFKQGDSNFVLDEDCAASIGPKGPKTLDEVRSMLGIPVPDFAAVNLNKEEEKVTLSSGQGANAKS